MKRNGQVQIKTCRKKQHVRIDDIKELPNLICDIFAVGGNNNSTRDNGSLPLYHVDRVIRETKKVAANGFEEVYVNASVRDESRVSKLMEIFVKDSVYDEHFPRTTEGKQRYKETEGGLNIMCEIMERIAEEEREEGRKEGIYEKAKEVARKMLKAGKTLEEIELFTGLTEEELERIEKGK